MKNNPVIKIKDDPAFSATHIEVSVRFDWEFAGPGSNKEILVTFDEPRGPHSIDALRGRAVARAKEILREALTPASS